MKEFLRKVWSGQIMPSEDWMPETEEIKELRRLKAQHKENLIKTLDENSVEILEKLIDCDNEIQWIHNEEAFISGVRFAVNLFMEAI